MTTDFHITFGGIDIQATSLTLQINYSLLLIDVCVCVGGGRYVQAEATVTPPVLLS